MPSFTAHLAWLPPFAYILIAFALFGAVDVRVGLGLADEVKSAQSLRLQILEKATSPTISISISTTSTAFSIASSESGSTLYVAMSNHKSKV